MKIEKCGFCEKRLTPSKIYAEDNGQFFGTQENPIYYCSSKCNDSHYLKLSLMKLNK